MSSSMREFSCENHQSPVQQMRPIKNWGMNGSNFQYLPFDSHLFLSLADHTSSMASSSASSSSSSSPSHFHPYFNPSSQLPLPYYHEQQGPTEPWNQSLLGGAMVSEDGRCRFTGQLEHRKVENRVDQVVFPTVAAFDMKQEIMSAWNGHQNYHQQELLRSSWNEVHDLPAFPTKSCMNSSFLMNNPNSKKLGKPQHPDHSSKNDTTSASSTTKKARVQSTNFKVRKEKLGDRIAALHHLVSPFGKTDTASVLSEATGYIRFLQSQIEALSTPYLGRSSPSSCSRHPASDQCGDQPRTNYMDLRSRGLCLVPLSCTSLQVGDDGGAHDQFWASAFGGDF